MDNIANESKPMVFKKIIEPLKQVLRFVDGICLIGGLENAKMGSVVEIESSNGSLSPALVLNINKDQTIDAILLDNVGDVDIIAGSKVQETGNLLQLGIGLKLFGSVVNGIGEVSYSNAEIASFDETLDRIEKKAEGIIDRIPVKKSLLTGTKSVDGLIPIGRGQRELIIGDRQTGKTSIAIDCILNFKELNNKFLENSELLLENLMQVTWFIYCAIGQKQSTVSNIHKLLMDNNCDWFSCIVSATASESAALQFLAPYTGSTIGEYIRDFIGGDSVIIFDDLSKHAVAYRQMSLLLRRPPGREAFPGDIFYVHSRLLERAGSLCNKFIFNDYTLCRGTMTALPIIETQAGDVSAYIPTNVISITDGQIFLESDLFYRGIIPAVNVGLSVSRVGSAAQPALLKLMSGSLKIALAQYREIENFVKFGAELDDLTQRLLFRGENIVEVLKQDLHKPLNSIFQTFHLFLSLGLPSKLIATLAKLKGNSTTSLIGIANNFISWFENLRLNTTLASNEIQLLLNNFKNFLIHNNLFKFFELNMVDTVAIKLLNKFPNFFFDDFFRMFLLENQERFVNFVIEFEELENFNETKSFSEILNDYTKLKSIILNREIFIEESFELKNRKDFENFIGSNWELNIKNNKIIFNTSNNDNIFDLRLLNDDNLNNLVENSIVDEEANIFDFIFYRFLHITKSLRNNIIHQFKIERDYKICDFFSNLSYNEDSIEEAIYDTFDNLIDYLNNYKEISNMLQILNINENSNDFLYECLDELEYIVYNLNNEMEKNV